VTVVILARQYYSPINNSSRTIDANTQIQIRSYRLLVSIHLIYPQEMSYHHNAK